MNLTTDGIGKSRKHGAYSSNISSIPQLNVDRIVVTDCVYASRRSTSSYINFFSFVCVGNISNFVTNSASNVVEWDCEIVG
eukprot:COSAG06_NODE_70_length_25948_cov_5.079757_2_plen_81_part_00